MRGKHEQEGEEMERERKTDNSRAGWVEEMGLQMTTSERKTQMLQDKKKTTDDLVGFYGQRACSAHTHLH